MDDQDTYNSLIDDDDEWELADEDYAQASLLDDDDEEITVIHRPGGTVVRSVAANTGNWWGGYRAQENKLWNQQGGKGARGLTSWLGSWTGASRSADATLAQHLARTSAFVRGLAAAVTKGQPHHLAWAAEDATPSANPLSKRITLSPGPVRRLAAGTLDEADAQSVVGGVAIHEAGHLAHTPLAWHEAHLALAVEPEFAGRLDRQAALNLGGVVEDGFVEASVLREYPGFRSYLEQAWRDTADQGGGDNPVDRSVTKLQADWDKGEVLQLLQELNRRYEPLAPEEEAALATLTEEQQRFVRVGQRILGRGHNPALAIAGRTELTRQLLRLILDGTVPPEDQGEEGPDDAPKPGGDLNRAADTLPPVGAQPGDPGDLRGSTRGDTLDPQEQSEADREDQRERVIQKMPPLADGGVRAPVHWLNAANGANERASYEQARPLALPHVARLRRALHLRNNTPRRTLRHQTTGRLDDSRLAEAPLFARSEQPARLFARREVLSAPKAAIELLIDSSGSMSTSWAFPSSRDHQARIAAIMLDEAMQLLAREVPGGLDYAIHAHTTDGDSNGHYCALYRLIDERRQDRHRLGAIEASGGNYDGEALEAVIKHAAKRWADRQRLVLHVSDGLPNGYGHSGRPACLHVREIVADARKRGTTVINLFLGELDQDESEANLTLMYGARDRGWLHIPRPEDLPLTLGRVLTRQLRWSA